MNVRYNCYGGEDVVLDKLTGYKPVGFYIDVGAHSPLDSGSITKVFYERGWTGINIEPQKDFYQQLVAYRPRDTNLPIACGKDKGELELHTISGPLSGLTTALAEYSREDWQTIKVYMVPLGILCDIYLNGNTIDFLKIDVEGFEKDVIQGMDWDKYRPKILCIEATKPNTTIPVHEEWEHLLLAANYEHIPVETDLYNRYYIDERQK